MHLNSLRQWWLTPKLPEHNVVIPPEKRPEGFYSNLRLFFRHWLLHPVKRRIAKYYLWLLQNFFGLTVIGITGSSGKTTTKDMIASILSQNGETVATFDNIDPVFNIPTTILKCRPSTRYLCLEMGVEMPTDMDFYLWLAEPQIAVITNIYQTHTQFFQDTEGVALEKAKLIALPGLEMAILNRENSYLQKAAQKIRAKILWFGKGGDFDTREVEVTIKGTRFTLKTPSGDFKLLSPLVGSQFVENALAAAAVGSVCGLTLEEIKMGLESVKPAEHRMIPLVLKSGCLVLDDSYNNNPVAAQMALETLMAVAGKKEKIAVIGDMLELGYEEVKLHRDLGRHIAQYHIDYLIGVGKLAKHLVDEAGKHIPEGHSWYTKGPEEALDLLKPILKKDRVVLVKGSRSIGLERLVSKLD